MQWKNNCCKMIKKRDCILGIILLLFLIWLIYTNIVVGVTYIKLSYSELPASFDGFKIVQISDLHNAQFGKDNKQLLEKVKKENPDMIAITGDVIDSNRTDIEVALSFAQEISKIAPCYYVTGNHEAWISDEAYCELETGLAQMGVTILRDSEALVERDGNEISVIGINDPDFAAKVGGIARGMDVNEISDLSSSGNFTVLLSHRPEYYEVYKATDANLVLTGHAHGGQFRLPFIGGIVAPNQGLFPKYDSGLYGENEFAMIVSRGVGNSIIPVRFNNPPEMVVVELETDTGNIGYSNDIVWRIPLWKKES